MARTADALYLAGEVHALLTFAQVLATIHPDRDRLRAEFQVAEQVGLARVETQLVGEKLVQGYQFAVAQIQRALEDRPENC